MTSLNSSEQFANAPDGDPVRTSGTLVRQLFADLMNAPDVTDRVTRRIIETNCLLVHDDGSEVRGPADMTCCWYNTGLVEFPNRLRQVTEAVRYLQKREALIHHPRKRRWIRFKRTL